MYYWGIAMSLRDIKESWSFQYLILEWPPKSLGNTCSCITRLQVLAHFMSLVSFHTPWKHHNPEVFSYFPGVKKEASGMKWVKADISIIANHLKEIFGLAFGGNHNIFCGIMSYRTQILKLIISALLGLEKK